MNTTAEERNGQVVSTLYSAFADRDVATALDTMAKDIEWHESDDLPWGGVQHGREAVSPQHLRRRDRGDRRPHRHPRYRQFVDGRQFVEVLLAHLAGTQTTRDHRSPVRH